MRKYKTKSRINYCMDNLVQDFYNAFELDYSEQTRYVDGYKTVPTDVFIDLICIASSLEKVSFAFERGRYDLDQNILTILIDNSDNEEVVALVQKAFERLGR